MRGKSPSKVLVVLIWILRLGTNRRKGAVPGGVAPRKLPDDIFELWKSFHITLEFRAQFFVSLRRGIRKRSSGWQLPRVLRT